MTKRVGRFIDLTGVFSKYKGRWVAFDKDMKRVVSSGVSAANVYRLAVNKGVAIPSLFKVPSKDTPYIGVFIRDDI